MSQAPFHNEAYCPESHGGTFQCPYRISIERKMNSTIGNSVTFIMITNGRPRPLADGGTTILECDQKCFEIPVEIIKNSRKKFEGVLTGVADGNDIRIVWDADLTSETLGVIKETTNNTVSFQKKPGSTRW